MLVARIYRSLQHSTSLLVVVVGEVPAEKDEGSFAFSEPFHTGPGKFSREAVGGAARQACKRSASFCASVVDWFDG